MKRVVATDVAPTPKGPYEQAIVAKGLLFVSSQGPVDPQSGTYVTDSVEAQALQTLANVQALVEAAGASLADAVKVTLYLSDLALAPAVNEVYARHMPRPWPARSICQSAMVGFDVAMDVVVAMPED